MKTNSSFFLRKKSGNEKRFFNLFFAAFLFTAFTSHAQTFELKNPFGNKYQNQPVEVKLPAVVTGTGKAVTDQNGKIIGQVSKDGTRAFLAAGFEDGSTSKTLNIATVADPSQGVGNPVKLELRSVGEFTAAYPNGINQYYELSNGLCGVRIPANMQANYLPGIRVPAPIVGVQFKYGEWSGSPDFRSFVVPHDHNEIKNGPGRTGFTFTDFKSEVIEEGPFRTTVRLSITTTKKSEPYVFEITLYANEKFVKFHQLNGWINDWFLDLNLNKSTAWRPNRWRAGHTHHFENRTAQLPQIPGKTYNLDFPYGPGLNAGGQYRGEGEGDLFSNDVWVEYHHYFGDGKFLLLDNYNGVGHKYALDLKALIPWTPWSEMGFINYAFNKDGGSNSPVAGLLTGPASEITGYTEYNGPGEAQFSQHIPSWMDVDTTLSGGYRPNIIHHYMENWTYKGVADRNAPVFGVKFAMHCTSMSYFIWLGTNSDIIPDVNQLTADDTSPVWNDWKRYVNGINNIEDAQFYSYDWPDPDNSNSKWVEAAIVEKNKQLSKTGEYMGDYDFVTFWNSSPTEQSTFVDNYLENYGFDTLPSQSAHYKIKASFAVPGKSSYQDGVLFWYTFERQATEVIEQIATFMEAGKQSSGGLLSDDQWNKLKLVASWWVHHVFDEDRACFWNEGNNVGHGGGTMTSNGNAARFTALSKFPGIPELKKWLPKVNENNLSNLHGQIGRYGAQFTSTGYSGLAGIVPMLPDIQASQWKSYFNPSAYPDEYARDPRLRHYAHFVLNRTGVKDPRFGNIRVPIGGIGDGGPGGGHPAAGIMASAFRHIDPTLSKHLFWAWHENGRRVVRPVPFPKITDYQDKGTPYKFPKIANFPGNLTVHRSGSLTPNETAVYIVNGSFFDQHRESNESGEVHIDVLGKPLVVNWHFYASPSANNPLYRNVVSPLMDSWNKEGYDVSGFDAWTQWNDVVLAAGALKQGSYSKSRLDGAGNSGNRWYRQIALLTLDEDVPVIYIRDSLNKSADYMSTFWMETEGEITFPDGSKVTPALRVTGKTSTPDQGPSLENAGNLPAGVNTFSFRGHDWLKLYPVSYQKAGITDVGELADVDVHSVNGQATQAVVGHWRLTDGFNPFLQDTEPGGAFDDRQYLRVKFSGNTNITVFTPYFRGKKPADLKVTSSGESVTISYSKDGVSNSITITPGGYSASSGGTELASEKFPATIDARLYPESNDLCYGGEINSRGSSVSRIEITGAPTWANGTYERLPHSYVKNMRIDSAGWHNPFSAYSEKDIDTTKPCYRATFGDRFMYVFALKEEGYLIASLPGSGQDDKWLAATNNASDPVKVSGWTSKGTETGNYTVSVNWSNTIDHDYCKCAGPVANATASASKACVGAAITFSDNSTDAETYEWNFGNDATPQTANTADPGDVSFSTPGTKTVYLTVTNECSSDTYEITIDIGVEPAGNFTNTVNKGNPLQVEFTDNSTEAGSWNWDLGDGNTSTQQNPAHTYGASGTYTVCLTVTNACNTHQYCKDVTVSDNCTAPGANMTSANTGCVGAAITFSDNSTDAETFEWNFGQDASITTAGTAGPHNVIFSSTGTKTVTLTVSNSCGSDTYTRNIEINDKPEADDFETVIGSQGEVVFTGPLDNIKTWNWDFGDGEFSANIYQKTRHIYKTPGEYEVRLIISNECGSDTITKMIQVMTDILEIDEADNIKIYPNPNNGKFRIVIVSAQNSNLELKITDMQGRSVYVNRVGNLPSSEYSEWIDISDHATGLYHLHIILGNAYYGTKIGLQ